MPDFKLSDEAGLASAIGQALGLEVLVAVSDCPLETAQLSAAGQQRLMGLNAENRRLEWLCGRRALQAVMRELGDCRDVVSLDFPNRRYSLTHSHGTAIAVAVVDDAPAGIGIDYEQYRPVRHGIERFFLSSAEHELLEERQGQSSLLRLWTIKEAMFKSDPDNAGHLLKDYLLAPGLALQGDTQRPGLHIRYASLIFGEGPFAVAVSEKV